MSSIALDCSVDAFWQQFEPLWEREHLRSSQVDQRRRKRAIQQSPSDFTTILILF